MSKIVKLTSENIKRIHAVEISPSGNLVGGRGSVIRYLLVLLFPLSLSLLAAEIPATGIASFYGEELRGHKMANGKKFDPDKPTAASWFFSLGTRVLVTHGERSIVVEISDRGPAKRLVAQGRVIDLSASAFKAICNPKQGLCRVRVEKL